MGNGTPAVAARGRRLTLAEWSALDEDEPGELVDDVLEDEEEPSFLHEIDRLPSEGDDGDAGV